MSAGPSVAVDWSAFEDLDLALPGIVAAVVRSGSVHAWRSFGSEQPGGAALGIDTPLYVASIAKQFTAASIGLLVLDGAVSLDDSVRTLVPELHSSWSEARPVGRLAPGFCVGAPDAARSPDCCQWPVRSRCMGHFAANAPWTAHRKPRRFVRRVPVEPRPFPELGYSFVVLANSDEVGIGGFGARTMSFVDQFLGPALDHSLPRWTHTHGT